METEEELEALCELFFDSDSEFEFEGFTDADVMGTAGQSSTSGGPSEVLWTEEADENPDSDEDDPADYTGAPDGYSHPWLPDFSSPTGPMNVPDNIDEAGLFQLFFTDDVVNLIVTETNRYERLMEAKKGGVAGVYSRVRQWREVTVDEIKAFLAILLVMGVDKRPTYNLHWTTDPILEMPGFRKIMSRNRFLGILSFLHLVDNEKAPAREDPTHDKSYKVKPLADLIVPLWQRYFAPSKEISVDESMVPFKGRTELMQYMPAKPTKWGLKGWGLGDSKTGYVWNWQLYLGKQAAPREHGLGFEIVQKLVSPLYGKGHVIYMDNFFSSPALFHELSQCGTGACVTLRLNRHRVPQRVKSAKLRAKNPLLTDRDDPIVYISWFDKRQVNLMTTVHSTLTFQKEVKSKYHPGKRRVVDKPAAIQAYTKYMGGIDRADKAMSYYMTEHRTTKWWKKVFFYLMELCFCNALILHRLKKGPVKASIFRMKIVHGMLQGLQPGSSGHPGRQPLDPPDRLIKGKHYLAINPARLSSGKPSRQDCTVCSDRSVKRHQTQLVCKRCAVPLCYYPCFERFHCLMDYRIQCTPELHQE